MSLRTLNLGQTAQNLFERRWRGMRLIEAMGLGLALCLIFWICLTKVREGEDVKRLKLLDQRIAQEQAEVDRLSLSVSFLEQPRRLEFLARDVLGMQAVRPDHEADMATLSEISHAGTPVMVATAVVGAPSAAQTPHGLDLNPGGTPPQAATVRAVPSAGPDTGDVFSNDQVAHPQLPPVSHPAPHAALMTAQPTGTSRLQVQVYDPVRSGATRAPAVNTHGAGR